MNCSRKRDFSDRRVRRGSGFYIGTALELAIGRNPRILTGPDRLYLDHAATTPVLPEARAAMAAAFELWANPSSPHAEGRKARSVLEDARERIKAALGWRHDVIFTSGASEAVAIAARRVGVERRLIGATEHDIVPHEMGADATVIPVGRDGLIDISALDEALVAGRLSSRSSRSTTRRA